MKRTYSARALYTLLLMVSFQIFGGGNFAQAQTTATTTLSNESIAAEYESKSTGYRNVTFTSDNYSYVGYVIVNQQSKAKQTKFIQIKKPTTSLAYYIQLPVLPGAIKQIVMEVSGTTQTLGEGGNTATLLYSTSSTTSTAANAIGNATGDSKVTIVVDDNEKNTGYITATGAVRIYNIEITYATGGGSGTTTTDATWSITPTEVSVKAGETATATITTNYDGILTATSNDETIATASYANGILTVNGVKGGNAIITLSGAATSNYNAIEKTVNVAVTAATEEPKPIGTYYYKKITSLDELVDGAQYVFVCETKSVAMGEVTGDKGQPVTGIVFSDGILESNTSLNVFTLEKEGDVCYFRNEFGKYLNGANKTNLNTIDKDLTSKGIKWTVTMDGEDVKVNSAAEATRYLIANSSNQFGNYASSNYNSTDYSHIQLYRKVGEINAAETVDNYATFYVNYAYEMPEGMTGYAVEVETGGKLTMKEAYRAGEAVPAKTPLLLHGENAGTFHPVVLNKDVEAYGEYNELLGERDYDGYTTCTFVDPLFYKLAVNSEGKAGFFWGAENGAPFKMQKYTTAFLAAPKNRVSNVRGFVFNPGEATGIDSVATETEENAPVYTLSGIRVRTAKSKLPAGIYIMNGKKLMVK